MVSLNHADNLEIHLLVSRFPSFSYEELHTCLLAFTRSCTLVLALGGVELVADVQRVRVLGGVEVLVPSLHLPEIGNKRIVLIRLERILRTQLNIQTILQERLLKREIRFIVTTDAKFRLSCPDIG